MRVPPARHTAALYILFALTGIGLVLPGTLLPFLVRRWGWQDGRSGLLFFAFFVGTTLGAFCARGLLGRMLVVAALSVSMPLAMLSTLPAPARLPAILATGFGVGLAMTSVTLLRSRQAPRHRAAELTRLNLVWAAGAASAPFLLLQLHARLGLSSTLRVYAAGFLLSGIAAGFWAWKGDVPADGTWAAWRRIRSMPVLLAICLPLATGIEAGLGAWLVTFTARQNAARHAVITGGSALWAGLLMSRAILSSLPSTNPRRSRARAIAFAAVLVCGLLLMVSGASLVATAVGALLAGFGIGPLYPHLLALALNDGEAGNSGFLLAGAGSGLLPLLIGQVSQREHSLRVGLTVPLAGACVLLLSLLRPVPGSAEWSEE